MESTILNDQTEISNSRDFKLRRKHARLSLAICCRTRMINRENNAVCIALVYPDNYAEIGKIWLFEIAHFSFRGNNIRILGRKWSEDRFVIGIDGCSCVIGDIKVVDGTNIF